jgi:hypothetical protein
LERMVWWFLSAWSRFSAAQTWWIILLDEMY